jgi:hypothetical protein
MLHTNHLSSLLICFAILTVKTTSFAEKTTVQDSINSHFAKINESFLQLCESPALKSTKLSPAERLFVRTMKRNQFYLSLVRTNSRGIIISEAVRGKNVDRPNSNVENEKWFKAVKKSSESYYTIKKDNDRARYYLIWSKPLLIRGKFIGAVMAKIDLWDSFYEFSNSVYYPFFISLKNMGLFSHKWKSDFTFKEVPLNIPGVNNISVRYIPENPPASATAASDSVNQQTVSAKASEEAGKATDTSAVSEKAKSKAGLIFILISLIAGAGLVSFVFISRKRRADFLKSLDEE